MPVRTPRQTRLELERLESRDTPSNLGSGQVHAAIVPTPHPLVVAMGSLSGQFHTAPLPGQTDKDYVWGTAQGTPSPLGALTFGQSSVTVFSRHGSVDVGIAAVVGLVTTTAGDKLNLTGTATYIEKSPGVFTVVESFTVTNGTGAFAHVVGHPILVGTVNLQTGAASFTTVIQLQQ
jgi:hypothetical protein